MTAVIPGEDGIARGGELNLRVSQVANASRAGVVHEAAALPHAFPSAPRRLRVKQYRRVATRDEQLAATYLAMVIIAAIQI